MPALFALDQNFPEPIVEALNEYIVEAEFVSVRDIDPLLAKIDDWEILLSLHYHERGWDGLVTTDSGMLRQPREVAVIRQTNLTLVVAHDAGHDPIKATVCSSRTLPGSAERREPTVPRSGRSSRRIVLATIRGSSSRRSRCILVGQPTTSGVKVG